MADKHSSFYHFDEQALMPAEEKLEVKKKVHRLTIGIPANTNIDEHCLPLTPQAVEILTNAGHEVIIETGAGQKAKYSDMEYSEAGASLSSSRAQVMQCDIIFKVATFTEDDIALLKGNQLLFSSLQLSMQSEATIKALMHKRVTTVAFEYLKDEQGLLPVMESISEISGIVSMTIASESMSNVNGGKGVLLGGITGITPAEVIILGSGTAARYAASAALGQGAQVKIFDHSINNLRELENFFQKRLFTSLYYPRVLEKAIISADVVIGAQPFNSIPQYVVPTSMIKKMKPGSIIIDLNATQGGCFETTCCSTLTNPTYEKFGVIHYCVPNISARVSRTTTIALSNIFTSILLEIADSGGVTHYIKYKRGFKDGIYILNGILTNHDVSEKFNIPFTDIDLLMAAF